MDLLEEMRCELWKFGGACEKQSTNLGPDEADVLEEEEELLLGVCATTWAGGG